MIERILPDEIITVRTTGLDAKQVIDRLGGMGRDKPVRAIYIGADLFASLSRIERCISDHQCDGTQIDPDDLLDLIDPSIDDRPTPQPAPDSDGGEG
jgi:hypothetical protein